ncbi:DUF3037 domain-containing protein [Amycolatopsis carbonis]|uniref:DUF3037 domain-containing protein n=1 Tax=Amycolatopsis carbonis TaxID=715471 RepID=A0A9Y2MTE3_9PSEU|nr:DUF3037 domain-containing protein [Amycolatopsis sp. 2-15]WIX77681.1 DUF3037 domain-containing protein [Amycolatopsis sp. 2-15]
MSEEYEYAALRVVPRADREESMNGGVLLYCRARKFLAAAVDLDARRLHALDPTADVDTVRALLIAIAAGCADAPDAGRHFRWLTAPRSTVVRAGPVHTGFADDPAAELDRLLTALVRPLGNH